MPKVAVCFRLDDRRDLVERLCDRLAEEFGPDQVIYDGNGSEDTSDCDVLVVIVGPAWLTAAADSGNSPENPGDAVRVQVEIALAAGARIIPVLIGRAAMPQPEHLPSGLAHLPFQNGMQLRPDPDFRKDVIRLINAIHSAPSRPIAAEEKSKVIALLARGRSGAIVGFAIPLVCGLVILPFYPLAVAFGNMCGSTMVWPLAWFLFWCWKRRSGSALGGCLLLPPLCVGISFFNVFFALILAVFILTAVKRMSGLPIDMQNLSPSDYRIQLDCICATQAALMGAALGVTISAKKVMLARVSGTSMNYRRWVFIRGGTIGTVLGLLIAPALCELECLAQPPVTSSDQFSHWALFPLVFCLTALLHWLLFGFMTTAIGRIKGPFRS